MPAKTTYHEAFIHNIFRSEYVMDFIAHAKAPFDEDTFLLGADLIQQLKNKRRIMMAHRRDIEGYLTSPYH